MFDPNALTRRNRELREVLAERERLRGLRAVLDMIRAEAEVAAVRRMVVEAIGEPRKAAGR